MQRFDARTLQTVATINEFYRRTDDLYHEVARRAGLADCAFEILYSLMEHDGLSQKQLCEAGFSSKQTVNSSIKRLQEQGLVELQGEGRAKAVFLTERGAEVVATRIEPVFEAECAAVEAFSEAEKEQLVAMADRYTDSLAAQFEHLRF